MREYPLSQKGLTRLRDEDQALRGIPDSGPDSIEAALQQIRGSAWPMQLRSSTRRGFSVYMPTRQLDLLLIRAATASFRRVTSVKQADRNATVHTVIQLLSDTLPVHLHRFDIKKFYESLPRDRIARRIRGDLGLPRSAVRVFESLLQGCDAAGVHGLPRGVTASASLAEDFLRPVDSWLQRHPNVFFAARYVDDLIVITPNTFQPDDMRDQLSAQLKLLGNLTLNERKHISVPLFPAKFAAHFEYLGYAFHVSQDGTPSSRMVHVDISERKANRIRTKLCLAVCAHIRNPDFGLLTDRVRALTGNYSLSGAAQHQPRVGIFYSYPHVSPDPNKVGELAKLDKFLRGLLLGSASRLSRKVAHALSWAQRRELARYSFAAGHTTRRIEKFSGARIGQIVECWYHV